MRPLAVNGFRGVTGGRLSPIRRRWEAVVLLRGQDGVLRALSNCCRHRGTPLLELERVVVDFHQYLASFLA